MCTISLHYMYFHKTTQLHIYATESVFLENPVVVFFMAGVKAGNHEMNLKLGICCSFVI